MAFEQPAFLVGEFPANIDMTGLQFQAVDLVANTTGDGVGGAALGAPASAGVPALGILQNNPQVGEAGMVTVVGLSKAVVGASNVAINDLLATDTAGKLVPATTGQRAMAKAVEAATGGSNAVFTVLVLPYGKI